MINRIAILLLFLFFQQHLSSLPNPPLTPPLKAIEGSELITEEFLINHDHRSTLSAISWLDNLNFIYAINKEIKLYDSVNNMTFSLGRGTNPKISPDGQLIAFISLEDHQIWLMKRDGSDKRALTDLKNGFQGYDLTTDNFAWSSDSKHLACYRNNQTERFDLQLPSTIYLVDVPSGKFSEVYSDHAFFYNLKWFPGDDKLLISKMRVGSIESFSWIQSISLSSGEASTLVKFEGRQQYLQPQISPDGRQISLLYNAEDDWFNFMPSLGIISSAPEEGNKIKQLTHDIKFITSIWTKDSQFLLATRNYGPYNQIYKVDAKTGRMTQLTNAPFNIVDFALSPDGTKLLWYGTEAQGKSILRIGSIDGQEVQDLITTSINEKLALSEVREVEWETKNYPTKMRGLLFLPLHYQEGKKYPLIVDIHGGGEGAHIFLDGGILLDSPLEWHLWTTKGYAVFVPEFRSSAAFGYLAISRDLFQNYDLINCDMIDILAGIDALVKEGIVDNQRLAAIGHSAGGIRANWLTVATHRFRAIISKEGVADERLFATRLPDVWKLFGGSPWEVPENYLKNSALHHAKNGKTPTLFLMGNPKWGGIDEDNTVYQLYEALRENGIETEFIQYPDEGHILTLKKNREDALKRVIEWIDRWTTPQ